MSDQPISLPRATRKALLDMMRRDKLPGTLKPDECTMLYYPTRIEAESIARQDPAYAARLAEFDIEEDAP